MRLCPNYSGEEQYGKTLLISVLHEYRVVHRVIKEDLIKGIHDTTTLDCVIESSVSPGTDCLLGG